MNKKIIWEEMFDDWYERIWECDKDPDTIEEFMECCGDVISNELDIPIDEMYAVFDDITRQNEERFRWNTLFNEYAENFS
jgi:hypothetical protein